LPWGETLPCFGPVPARIPIPRREFARQSPFMIPLDRSLASLRGIGPKRAAELAALGYEVCEDLLFHLPFRYEDRRLRLPLSRLAEGDRISFLATVRAPRTIWTRRRGFNIFQAKLDDGTAVIPAVWYNQPYLARALPEGREAWFFGELRRARTGDRALRFENPQYETVDPEPESAPLHTARIVPVYERLGSLSGKMVRALVHAILEGEGGGGDRDPGRADDPLPDAMRARLGFPARDEALRLVHFPEPGASLETLNAFATPHYRRLVFDEFFQLHLGLALRRARTRRAERGFVYIAGADIRARLAPILPYTLTGGQTKVFEEIVADLTSPHPMHRLLQGEVGSGKTILAALAMALAAENGLQAALMAPTEVLAEQHAHSLGERLAPVGHPPVLLTSSVKGAERRARLAALASGEARIAVGTHALIEEGVTFARLGLVVVDEQHRFGVMQRARLGGKGSAHAARSREAHDATDPTAGRDRGLGTGVDTLVMTATPIPRTLALAAYGDLDLSVLDEMPPGRSPVTTRLLSEADRPRLDATLRAAIAAGRQVYVVTPLAVGSEKLDLKAARETAESLAAGALAGSTVGLLHGRMKPAEKSAVMDAFRAGRLAALVATTVVEVGIDVPNATLLVVEHAERFGLSQLHQLRGRIGRGAHPGTCLLVAGDDIGETARARLDAIENETSGFRLAEIDLSLRGPGEVLGTRQSGLPDLRAGDLVRDRDLFEIARTEAFTLVEAEGEDGPAVRRFALGMRAAWRRRWLLSAVG
jgi:ATP-dependent DNA helicase RecG